METFTDIKKQISLLRNEINGKDLEITLLEGEIIDVNRCSVLISQTTSILLGMMAEIIEFQKKKPLAEKGLASKKRLLTLLELNSNIDSISTDNYRLKSINREIHTNYQLLRIENMKLKQQIINMQKAFDGL